MIKKEKIKIFTTAITAGIHKGKKIEIPDIFTTRSSKGILKESLFNTLQFDIIDKNFVELFSGSGSIGLEALSRGAGACYFMEYNKTAFACLEGNVKRIDASKSHLFYGDSFEKFSLVYAMVKKSKEKTYFYFDPPFSTRDGMDDIYDKTIALIESIEPHVAQLVIVEHMTNLNMPEKIGAFKQIKRKKFGRSALTYYAPIIE
ncbi:MAG: 16S rRNA (guanine(966)-N(2))-methyltransferase RsmD [Campylobacterota bacterium]|nr:16S rRNA (guanine(966)-N(2))-methyltransferase RsmD [Campylobacterota bacterium]